MAGGDRGRALREEPARLDAEMADGERNADDVAAEARCRAEVEAEIKRLGIGAIPATHRPATDHDPS